MWMIKGFAAFFFSVIFYYMIDYCCGEELGLSGESMSGLILFTTLYVGTYYLAGKATGTGKEWNE